VSASRKRREAAGWSLKLDLPYALSCNSDELVSRVIGAVESKSSQPLRQSRKSRTYRLRFRSSNGVDCDLFVKCFKPAIGFERLERFFRKAPARRISEVTGRMIDAGISVPPVWITGFHAASRRDLIVCPCAPGYGPLRTLSMLRRSIVEKREALRQLGRAIASLQRAGFIHGDLTPFNIFFELGEVCRFTFLDHERTHLRGALQIIRPLLRNLVQLGRFDLPGISRTDRLRVLIAYLEAMKFKNRRRMIRRLSIMLQRRLARDGGFERAELPILNHPGPEKGINERGAENFSCDSRVQ
jgi:hypothetical protein